MRASDPDPQHGNYPPQADSITIAGDEVKLCWGTQPARTCWRIDVAKQVFFAQAVTPAPDNKTPRFVQRPHAKAVLRVDGTVSLCGPGGSPCKSFANPGPTKQPEWAAVSDDLSTVAIPDGGVLRIYDAASARVRATIKGWPDSPMPGNRFMYSPIFATRDRMIVWYSWSPVSEQGRVFDMSGKQLAIVGGKDFAAIEPNLNSWLVEGTEWVTKGEASRLDLGEKIQELCEALLQDDGVQSARERIEKFLQNPDATRSYAKLANLNDSLHQKQMQGEEITEDEGREFEALREEVMSNPAVQDFAEARGTAPGDRKCHHDLRQQHLRNRPRPHRTRARPPRRELRYGLWVSLSLTLQ